MTTQGDYDKYQTEVGRKQGGDTMFFKSGGILDVDEAFTFYLGGVDRTKLFGAQLDQKYTKQTIGQGAASTVFSVPNYPGSVGMIVLSMTSTCVNASFAMISDPVPGENVIIALGQGSTISGLVTILFSGCSFVGRRGSTLNSVTLYNSVDSTGRIELRCYNAGEWTLVDYGSSEATGVVE
jgi:hypothetical protein